jgi:hypothetical protein
MKKQHAITQDYFERLVMCAQKVMQFFEARRNQRKVRAFHIDTRDISPHIRKDIGLNHDYDTHLRR